MPLTLITGPANAAKAGAVLERFRAALPREPVLVVPTPADAEHYQRELAAEGIVVGARGGDVRTPGARARGGGRRARARRSGAVARERLVRAVVAEADLEALARSAAAPGFAGGRRRRCSPSSAARSIGPARFTRAVRDWEAAARRRRTPASSPRCTRPTTAGSSALGAVDAEGLARAALDAAARAARRRGAGGRCSSTGSTT